MVNQSPSIPHLTEQQQQIVAHTHGPALVYAVAGAGKTTAMVHRVARLVRDHVFAPERILLSSFNKAAVDDLGRALIPWPACRAVARCTLHGLGYRIVRFAAEQGVLPPLAEGALKANGEERHLVWAARDLARQRKTIPSAELDTLDEQDLLDFIGACKGNLSYPNLAAVPLPPAARTVASQAHAPPHLPWYLDLYALHEEVRHARGWLTFDDMLLLSWEALVCHPDLLARWQRRYDAVLVDEFQDVNLAQSELLDLLTRPHRNYMAIGDDDQTIYGFRGASMDFFRQFGDRYGATIYTMTDNFRCRASHVVLANRVIAQNRDRYPKTLVATRGFGGVTALRRAPDTLSMARHVVADCIAAQATGMLGRDMTILVRLGAQTPPLEQALIEAGLAYRIVGDMPFFRRREVGDLMAYVTLAEADALLRLGQQLDASQRAWFTATWQRVYNRPTRYMNRHLFQETLQAVCGHGRPLSDGLLELSERVNERMATTLSRLATLLIWLSEARNQLPAETLLSELDIRLDYQAFLRRSSGHEITGASAAANVTAFIQYARGKGDITDLQAHLAELEAEHQRLDEHAADAIDIRTIHKAKGLEWPVVLVPNCTAGIIPLGGDADLDEERRLLYVAITRAKEQLYLYAPVNNGGQGQISPFLAAAQVERTLTQVAEVGRLLASDPRTWSAAEALRLLRFPRETGQARSISHWWDAPAATRSQVVERLRVLVASVATHGATQRLGVRDDDLAPWVAAAPQRNHDATLAAPFPDLAALLTPTPTPPPSSKQPRTTVTHAAPYHVGDVVRHPKFGHGVVIAVEPQAIRERTEWYIKVDFRQRGVVKLNADIAPLER
ncbi:ATP-dependent helicase [Candidatus Viridilinea mediisalina]|nr:ATP-dependent helicase [Candidatus Viridilinea mediisalina]